MSWDEHVMLIAHTVHTFGDQLHVIGNTGSNSTREALHATEQGFAVGMHAALQINPYYGKTSLDGLMSHFTALLNEGPAIIYNVPGEAGMAEGGAWQGLCWLQHRVSYMALSASTRQAKCTKYFVDCVLDRPLTYLAAVSQARPCGNLVAFCTCLQVGQGRTSQIMSRSA